MFDGLTASRFLFSRLVRSHLARDIRQRGILQDVGGSVAHLHENAVQLAVWLIAVNQLLQAGAVGERRQGSINGSNDLAEEDLVGRALELIAALGAAHA